MADIRFNEWRPPDCNHQAAIIFSAALVLLAARTGVALAKQDAARGQPPTPTRQCVARHVCVVHVLCGAVYVVCCMVHGGWYVVCVLTCGMCGVVGDTLSCKFELRVLMKKK